MRGFRSTAPRPSLPLPSYPWRFAHLAALWGYGVSQPVFAMLSSNPEFLVINGASRAEAVTFALVLAFGPPLAAIAIEATLGVLSTRAAAAAHLLCVCLFGFTALVQLLSLFEPSSRLALIVPAAASYAGAVVYMRWSPLRTFLSLSLVLPVVGLVVFVTTAPLALADSEGAHVAVGSETPVVLVVFDEFPVSSLMRADGTVDSDALPRLRAARARRHVVLAHDHGRRAHDARRSGDPDGARPGPRRAPDARGPSSESLHAARRVVRVSRSGAGDASLSRHVLPRATVTAVGGLARQGSSARRRDQLSPRLVADATSTGTSRRSARAGAR